MPTGLRHVPEGDLIRDGPAISELRSSSISTCCAAERGASRAVRLGCGWPRRAPRRIDYRAVMRWSRKLMAQVVHTHMKSPRVTLEVRSDGLRSADRYTMDNLVYDLGTALRAICHDLARAIVRRFTALSVKLVIEDEEQMPSHKFHVGEIVSLKPAVSLQRAGRRLCSDQATPRTGSEFEYLIKSATEPHERVARESELTKGRPAAGPDLQRAVRRAPDHPDHRRQSTGKRSPSSHPERRVRIADSKILRPLPGDPTRADPTSSRTTAPSAATPAGRLPRCAPATR